MQWSIIRCCSKFLYFVLFLTAIIHGFGQDIRNSKCDKLIEKGNEFEVQNEFVKAAKAYKTAVKKGCLEAQLILGLYAKDHGFTGSEMRGYFQMAADRGVAEAQFWLGMMYKTGYPGIEISDRIDMSIANNWFAKAASQNYLPAQYQLGVSYLNALGLKTDTTMAIQLLHQSAKQGYNPSQRKLAEYYYDNRSFIKALEWYLTAAENGDFYSFSIAMSWTWNIQSPSVKLDCQKLSNLVQTDGLKEDEIVELAKALERGHLCKADTLLSIKLYEKAAKNGNVTALEAINRLKKK